MSLNGRVVLTGLFALSLGLTGIAGCGSSPNGSTTCSGSALGDASSQASPSAGCFLSGFVSPGQARRRAATAGSTRLASYDSAALDVPIPDIHIDDVRPAGGDLHEQSVWAQDGLDHAQANPIDPPAGDLQATEQNLQAESNAVAYHEEVVILGDDLDSQDPGYGEEICASIEALSKYVENLDDLNQVVQYLQQLSADN